MKKLIVSLFALLLLIGGTVNAQIQTTKTPAEIAKTQVDNINAAIVLNEDQNTKVYAFALAAATQKDSLNIAHPGINTPAMKDYVNSINDARDVKIKLALTKEQAEAYEAKKAELLGL
jgi:hypothetical protein